MAVRTSIFSIEVRDDAFKGFIKQYDAYQASLKAMPAAWAKVNEKVEGSRKSFDKIVEGMVAAAATQKLLSKAQEAADEVMKTSADRWKSISSSTKEVARNIGDITLSMLRWGSVLGVGAVFGSFFGMDRLAGSVSAGRRGALGLGVSYGERAAFGANFGRFVDPDSFLSSVSGAQLDVQKRVGLIGAGLSQQQISGSAAGASVALLQNLKRLADNTDPALYQQVISARRLDQFTTPEDLRRLRNTSPAEIAQIIAQYNQDRGTFGLDTKTQKAWQDFQTQLGRAGQGIENAFVTGLTPVVGGFTALSESAQKVITAFLASPALKEWLDKANTGLEAFANYVGTDDFAKKIASFVDGIGKLADIISGFVNWMGGGSGGSSGINPAIKPGNPQTWGQFWGVDPTSPTTQGLKGDFGGGGHNPGNLRPPGQSTGFDSFATDDAGIARMAWQLKRYNLNTVQGLISKYAPPNENDVKAYVGDVTGKTGFGAGQSLDLNDNATLSRLIAAMVSHEQAAGRYTNLKDPKVVLEILNSTGGSAVASVNAMKQ